MTPKNPPKAILFDIGGVCVVSPFQAILNYERENHIPVGWINFAIQKGPHDTGAWQLIERGEVELNDEWFEKFRAQLSVREHWVEFVERERAKGKGRELGIGEVGEAVPEVPGVDAKKLFWRMMRLSRTPDPHMYPALRRLRQHPTLILAALSNTIAYPPNIVDDTGAPFQKGLIHAPSPNPYANDSPDIADCFDVFISSAHVGLRKPDPRAYELAVRECDRVARAKGLPGIEAGDVLFLDDIGVNLKWARRSGLRTIKVELGRTGEAVRLLEVETGLRLSGEGEGGGGGGGGGKAKL
ncbi:HAD-like protein [Westerdykella ornata]|uniref:HAD-like protein n=1 Tax=Westerdykella ornata TaxID=318751 RepID=A0A6A6JQX3_WESOR|nr:HAD-like protein [Westerdykella ornata]KAF2278787.1 HAD-like protein [Westerdykella ornata]